VTPAELVEAAIARIERWNPSINAVVTAIYDDARRVARRYTPAPLGGVPMLLKDSHASYAGVATTSASRLLCGTIPRQDSELVRRFKRAGLIILGKANCAELGLTPTTEPSLFGPTRNPWDLHRSPGGSSGGSAAAVATGMVSIAHGTDGGGSIRIPASCCGVFGFKPSWGRNRLESPASPAHARLVVEHVITRSVRDSAKVLDLTCARSSLLNHDATFRGQVGIDPGRLRIAFGVPAEVPVHPDCLNAMTHAAALCGTLGHEVIEATPAFDHAAAAAAFSILWAAGCAAVLETIGQRRGQLVHNEEVEPLTWHLYQRGLGVTALEYGQAEMRLQEITRSIAEFFDVFDVWLTPTVSYPPPPLGSFSAAAQSTSAALSRAGQFAAFAATCNFTGQPGMSVPLYWTAAGVPIGSHFAGRLGDEATLFRLAAQLEQAYPWANRRPPLRAHSEHRSRAPAAFSGQRTESHAGPAQDR
jgi:amidase